MHTPRVFLSHSHPDKQVVRRIARSMDAYGIAVWLDERELRLGTELLPAIRDHIIDSDILMVVASRASAASTWVERELDFAVQAGKPVLSVFMDAGLKHARLEEHLWADASNPQQFAEVLRDLIREIHRRSGQPLPSPDHARLEHGLRELADDEPGVAPLVVGCLDSEGLHRDNMETAYAAPFHAVDEALDALFELKGSQSIAYHAAYGFHMAGAGVRALSLWIKATGDGGGPLCTALGCGPLAPSLVPAAIRLLAGCDPPNNLAIGNFVQHNAALLDDAHRKRTIRLITWPVRATPERSAGLMAQQAIQHFPESAEIRHMWERWIREGGFDSNPRQLLHDLLLTKENGLDAVELLVEALRRHIRQLLRSGDEAKVHIAANYLIEAAETRSPSFPAIHHEVCAAPGTAEWESWARQAPDTADWMASFLRELSSEAMGGQNWLHALNEAKRKSALTRKLRELREQP